ncbi:ATP-binding cassette sub-family C member 4 [Dendroctonus ponderosae]|uniref:ATP-binding cassette sub-family C member 4 n=1 Tax=Dendroctonus ponderosae TaxID=77166 RepID=UPI002035226F|nr:ATP-binding cassette sub-family C member 4 [Dendroctonus ponderosae]KAH1004933.1 hypothetical protein HUJ05_005698 [Dendroctonus ponderosae]
MDQGERTVKKVNPRQSASIASIIFFCFTAPILRIGRRRDLQEKDVYRVLPKFESENLGNRLEKTWSDSREKQRKQPEREANQNGTKANLATKNQLEISNVSIVSCLVRTFGWYYFGLGVLQLAMKTAVILLQPRVISKFVAYFDPSQESVSRSEAYKYAAFVILVNVISCIYNHNYQQLIMEYSVAVRASLCSLIYRKALKLNSVDFSESSSMGKVVTLITKDVHSIDGAMMFLNDMWIGAIQVAVITFMLYRRIGASVFVGIGFFLLVVPVQSYCGRKFSLTRLVAARKAEERIQLVKEALSAIRIIKMYTWEKYFEKLITLARINETDKLKIIYYLKATILTLGGLTMKVAFFLLIMTYTLIGQSVTAETVYFTQQCFFVLRSCITTSIPMGINNLAELCAAMRRFRQYLNTPEFRARNIKDLPSNNPRVFLNKVSVKIQEKKVLRSVSLDVESGLLIVTGNIGSGKSSLLKTILNEYAISAGKIGVRGTISYAPEEPWLFPSTIRQNILFGQPYDEKRYQEVLQVCALTYDLNQFEKLDNTVVGDKGINLSKGQQARICLARAVYKDSDIYLLDDCLSALDAHVNNHVFKECVSGFLSNKLVILISNNVNNIRQVPTGNVLFMENGETLDLDQQKKALDKRITYYIDEDNPYSYDDEDDDEDTNSETDELLKKEATEPRRNIFHEENKQGSVLWKNYVTYYKYTGGIMVLIFTVLLFAICQFALAYSEKLLSQWVNTESVIANLVKQNGTESGKFDAAVDRREHLLRFYTAFVLIGALLTLLRSFSNFYFCTQAGRKLHQVFIVGVLNAYMSFFDSHYIGNIVNRVSKDFHTIDENIPFIIYENLRSFFIVLSTIVLIASVNFTFLVPSFLLFVVLFFIQRYYIPTGRSLKRLEAATRSPMIGYINASLEGLATVHACQEEKLLQHEFDRHQDFYISAHYMSNCAVRAFAFSMDMTCMAFISYIVLKFALYPNGANAGDVGLAVTQAMTLVGLLQWAVRQAAEMENTMTSVERVLEYAETDQEYNVGSILPDWPQSGSLRYENVSLTYKTTGERVLKNISFEIGGKGKIGIVGRTGAGKSSIISVLFRLYDYEGTITIDGVNIKSLNLEHLRSHVGIIPQDPILFRGTIRSNIDPLHQHSDQDIWAAIEKVQMKKWITSLFQEIDDYGQNYSSGQRQLICLARALVCRNQIIVLDEATASMDVETDQLLQRAMQDHFENCTVLTIAHRMASFQAADKILVVDGGRIVQFDNPAALLQDKQGLFYKMVQDAGGLDFV